jgi:two-component system chemotaxis sensor kinase CheA
VDTAKYAALFLAESRDHLQHCNRLLLAWERHPAAEEPVAGLFRSVHTLKGMASAMGFDRLADLAHRFEGLLQGLRDGVVPASVELVELGFGVVDRLEEGVGLAVEGRDADLVVEDLAAALAQAGRSPGLAATPVWSPPGGPRPAESEATPARLTRQVRVELDRLDTLVALAGEVVVARTRLAALAEQRRDPELIEATHHLGRLVTDLHGQVLHTRMAPVGEVFERFPRVVRDLARQLDKRVRLETAGEAIELDRAILDQLPDLLVHLVRNAVDHGIESPAERVAVGKPQEGCIRLEARRLRNRVQVSVTDDGRGIDRVAVLGQEGIGESGDDAVLLDILSRPGFSTARTVTDVSGRGVGVDAVVHGVRQIGGRVSLATWPGRGTCFTLELPLTMAIVPALLVAATGQRYALPLAFVRETARLPAGTLPGMTVDWRGTPAGVVALTERLSGDGPRPGVVLEVGPGAGAGGGSPLLAVLLVDDVVGYQDLVVSQVEAPRGMPEWITGASILPDGQPALLLDPAGLVGRR